MTQIVPISHCGICNDLISSYDTVMIPKDKHPFEELNPNIGIALECDKKTSHIFHAKCLKFKQIHPKYTGFYTSNCPTCQKKTTHVRVLNHDLSRKYTATLCKVGDILVTPKAMGSITQSITTFLSENPKVRESFYLFDQIP